MIVKLLITIIGCTLLTAGCWGPRPSSLGVEKGKLKKCPHTPNCVSSQEEGSHFIEPIPFKGTLEDARRALLDILKKMKRTEVITSQENYIHAESTSLLFRFVDDVEFYLDDSAKLIHVRSASRVGRSDLGVNRKRVEEIREAFSSRIR
jgi:uncharacterized protein (DUF1499 family)